MANIESDFENFADIAINLKIFPKKLEEILGKIQLDLKIDPYGTLDNSSKEIEYINKILHLIITDSKKAYQLVEDTRNSFYYRKIDKYEKMKNNVRSINELEKISEKMEKDIDYKLAKNIVSPKMVRLHNKRIKESKYEDEIKNMTEKNKSRFSKDFLSRNGYYDDIAFPEVTMQENTFLANRCAHWCEEELNDIVKNFKITDKDKIKSLYSKNNENSIYSLLKKSVSKAIDYHNINIPKKERINFEKLNSYLEKNGVYNAEDLDYEEFINNEEVKKINNLMNKFLPNQKINFQSINGFSRMFQLTEKTMEFYNLKNKLIEIELEMDNIARKDIKETGGRNVEKSTVSFIVEDDMVNQNKDKTYRLLTMNKDFYERYLEFSNDIFVNGTFSSYLTKKAGISEISKEKSLTIMNEYLDKKCKDKYNKISASDFDAILRCSNVSTCHVPKDIVDTLLDDENLDEIDKNPSTLIKCLARGGVSILQDQEIEIDNELIEEKFKNLKKSNEINKKKYNGDIEKFKKDYNLEGEFLKDSRKVERFNE